MKRQIWTSLCDVPDGSNVIRVNVAFPTVVCKRPKDFEDTLIYQDGKVSCLKQHLFIEILNSERERCNDQDDINKLSQKIANEIMESLK